MSYIYLTKRAGKTIGGILTATSPFNALFDARKEVFIRGGDIKSVLMTKI